MTQTWQNVRASRALNTAYTSGTGATIAVNVAVQGDGSATLRVANTDNFSSDDIVVGQAGGQPGGSMSAMVPAGAWYQVRGGPGPNIGGPPLAIVAWAELR